MSTFNLIMKVIYIIVSISILFLLFYRFRMPSIKTSIQQFKAITLEGEVLDFSDYKGKKILIVNTASKCGFTPQYKELEMLYEKYKNKNFVIVGFPCNQFGKQEPGTNADIKEFCTRNYGVTFIMMDKIRRIEHLALENINLHESRCEFLEG